MLHESKILTYRLGGYPSSFGFDGGLHSLELGPAFLMAVQNVRFISCFPLSHFINRDKLYRILTPTGHTITISYHLYFEIFSFLVLF